MRKEQLQESVYGRNVPDPDKEPDPGVREESETHGRDPKSDDESEGDRE